VKPKPDIRDKELRESSKAALDYDLAIAKFVQIQLKHATNILKKRGWPDE